MTRNNDFKNFKDSDTRSIDDLSRKFTSRYVSSNCLDYYTKSEIGFKWEKGKSDCSFDHLGKHFDLPYELIHIKDELVHSKYITNLNERNWDGEGAAPISKELYIKVVNFLVIYAKHLFTKGVVIASPEINASQDGSIDLSWRTNEARLLINFKMIEEKMVAKFFGDLNQPFSDKFGFVEIDKIDLALAEWMRKLRK